MICSAHIDGLLPNERAVGSAVAVAWLGSWNFLLTLHKITQFFASCPIGDKTFGRHGKLGIEPVPAA